MKDASVDRQCQSKHFFTKYYFIFCFMYFCSAIGFITIILKARHEELIVWRLDDGGQA